MSEDKVDLSKILKKLRPNATYKIIGKQIIWKDKNYTQPTEQEILDIKDTVKEELWFKELRRERNVLLSETDKYLLEDYPITNEQKTLLKKYRKDLRDLPGNSVYPIKEFPEKPIID